MRVRHLKTGWKELSFQGVIQQEMDKQEKLGYSYYDIKISSKDNDCLLIFKENEN